METQIRIEASTIEELRQRLFALSAPQSRKDISELVPLRSWSYDPTFAEVLHDAGPFVLKHCPRGRNEPPDWEIVSAGRRTSIEVTMLTTPKTEVAEKRGRSVFDMPGLLGSDEHPRADFFRLLEAADPYADDPNDGWELSDPVDQVFFETAWKRFGEKYNGLSAYRGEYDCRVLLIWEKFWSVGGTLESRSQILSHWLSKAHPDFFDAVIMTGGGIRTQQLVRLK